MPHARRLCLAMMRRDDVIHKTGNKLMYYVLHYRHRRRIATTIDYTVNRSA